MPIALLALALGAFGIGTTEFVMMGVLPQAAADLGVSISSAGNLITGYALGVVIGAPTLTLLGNRLPRKTVLIGTMALFTAGNALFALAPSAGVGMAFRFVAGLPHGAFFGVGAVVAAGLVRKADRAKAVSMMFMGLTLANVVGVPLGMLLGQQVGWRATFAVVAAIGVVAIAAIARLVPALGKPQPEETSVRGQLAAFRKPQVWLALAIVTFGLGGTFACLSYLTPILTGVSGYSETGATVLLMVAGLGMTVGNVLGGRVADKALVPGLYAALIGVAAVLGAFTVTSGNQVGAAVTVFLIGVGGFMVAPIMQAMIMEKAGGNRPKLAYHLVRTGPDFDSSTGAQVLIEEADRVAETTPSCAATWYHAALRQLATDDERWPDLLRTLLRLRTSLGQYRELTEDIGLLAPAASGTGDALRERRTLLVTVGMCWLSALLHDERAHPEPEGMFAAFGGGSRFDAEIRRFSSALFDGRLDEAAALLNALFNLESDEADEPGGFIELGEVLLLLNAICGHDEDFQHAWSLWQRRCSAPVPADPERLREAGAMTDYATALELILGDDYGRPSRGSVLRYQEVLRAYLGGAWDTALSLARRMETELPAQRSAPARYLARAVAAEICSARGELRRASEWLHRSPRVMDGGHIVAWVRLGVRYQEGATGEALDEGWQDYLQYRDRGSPAGLERLLGRLVELAHREDRTEFAERALAELAELDGRLCSASSREQLLTAQARTYRSPEHAEQALALSRRRGDKPARGGLFLLLADLADEPADWLHEAYALAKQLGWHVARTTSQELMRARGVAPPRSRSRREPFSRTEIRIIDLVSDGCTNRQIAMAVQVSEKTVESHLTKLFARTGCRSRVELAAASLEGRLPAKSGA